MFTALAKARVRKDMDPEVLKLSQVPISLGIVTEDFDLPFDLMSVIPLEIAGMWGDTWQIKRTCFFILYYDVRV